MRPRHVLLLGPPRAPEAHESLVLLRDYLLANTPWRCEVRPWPGRDGDRSLDATDRSTAGLEDDGPNDGDGTALARLDEAHGVVVFAALQSAGTALEAWRRHGGGNRAVVALGLAGHAFDDWPGFEDEFFGGHCGARREDVGSTRVTVAPRARDHPVVAEVEPFDAGGPLGHTCLADDAEPLLLGHSGAVVAPVAWACQRGGRRVATCLGHPQDFWELDFLRLVRNALAWGLETSP